jgi:hypothetical protein
MNGKIEAKVKPTDPRDLAFQSHEEAAGFVGMPVAERKIFNKQKPVPVAEPPDAAIGRPVAIVPENN